MKAGESPRTPKPDDWLLARMQRNGFPLNVRMANAYRGLGRVPGYEHKIIIVVPLRDPQPSGLPKDSEFDDLKAVEISLCGVLEAENESLCVLAITGCGTRDLVFYTRNPKQARKRIEAIKAIITSHKIDVAIQPDKNWELYGFFNKAIAASSAPETKAPA
jgi:hypothetical protein